MTLKKVDPFELRLNINYVTIKLAFSGGDDKMRSPTPWSTLWST